MSEDRVWMMGYPYPKEALGAHSVTKLSQQQRVISLKLLVEEALETVPVPKTPRYHRVLVKVFCAGGDHHGGVRRPVDGAAPRSHAVPPLAVVVDTTQGPLLVVEQRGVDPWRRRKMLATAEGRRQVDAEKRFRVELLTWHPKEYVTWSPMVQLICRDHEERWVRKHDLLAEARTALDGVGNTRTIAV